MPTKEEAEAMAEAILAANRKSAGASSTRDGGGGGGNAGIRWFLLAGFVAGAIVAVLPSHNLFMGGVVGTALAGVIGALATRRR
jgi:hypothetical protein